MEDLVGKQLGQYRIEAKIGEGGMATVFKAYQPSLDRYVAVKVLSPTFASRDPNFVKRFEREAKSIAQLNHQNILPVYDYGFDNGYSYLVMRYVAGGLTLDGVMTKPLPQEQALDLIVQLAKAMDYAHRHNVIHRDIKPVNALMDGEWVLLSDFGLAKMSDNSMSRLTQTGMGLGTPAYMAPEQGAGEEVDHRADIYALGIIVYEMFTGTLPHDADTPFGIMMKRSTEPPIPPHSLNPQLPESMSQVIMRALAINPSDRYESAGDFLKTLQQAAADPTYREPLFAESSPTTFSKSATNSDSTQFLPLPNSATSHWPSWLVGIVGGLVIGMLLWFMIIRPLSTPPASTLADSTPAMDSTLSPSVTETVTPLTVDDPLPTQATLLSSVISPTATLATPQPTNTPSPSMTATNSPTATATPTTTTPSPEIGDIIFSPAVQANYQPLSPTTVFSGTTSVVYASFRYDNMVAGESWRPVWSLEEEIKQSQTEIWTQGEKGRFAISLTNEVDSPLEAGNWRLQIYVGLTLTQESSFTISALPTPTPTPTATPISSSAYRLDKLILWQSNPSGYLWAGQDKWFVFDSGGNPQATLIAFISNADGPIDLTLYHGREIPNWPPPNPDALPHVGVATEDGDRDNNSKTRELVWQGPIEHMNLYYLRLTNRTGGTIYYCVVTRPDKFSCP